VTALGAPFISAEPPARENAWGDVFLLKHGVEIPFNRL
jgi:hypothetical protein